MDVPEPPVMVVVEREHTSAVEFAATVKLTVPEKPFEGMTVIVELPGMPTPTLFVVGFAVIAKF